MLYNRSYVENSNAPTRHRTLRSGQRRPPSHWEFCKRRVLENFTSSAYKMHLPRQSLVGPALARLNAPFSHESRLFQGYIPASERRPPGGIVNRPVLPEAPWGWDVPVLRTARKELFVVSVLGDPCPVSSPRRVLLPWKSSWLRHSEMRRTDSLR